jgi:hypothetical protein
MQDDDTDQDIRYDEMEGESEDTGETTLSCNIEEDNSDHQQQVLLLGVASRDKSSRTRRVLLPKQQRRANTGIACLLLPNPRKPPRSMAAPLFKCQKSALLNISSESDCAPTAQALPQPKSSGDQNALQPKASADQKDPQH